MYSGALAEVLYLVRQASRGSFTQHQPFVLRWAWSSTIRMRRLNPVAIQGAEQYGGHEFGALVAAQKNMVAADPFAVGSGQRGGVSKP